MSKKCLSLILVLSMIMQLICIVPAMATESTDPDTIRTYFVNDTFDTGLGDWVYGPGTVREGSLDWDEDNGYMVLTRTTEEADTANTNTMVKADRDFEDIAFAGNKIVIEARVKTTGNADGANNARLRMNLPVEEKYITYSDTVNYLGWAGGTIAHFDATDSTVKYKSNSYSTAALLENVAADEWVNIKAVFDDTDGNLQNYTLTAWKDNDEANAVTKTGSLKEFKNGIYDAENFLDNGSTTAEMYTALESLNFTLNNNESSITVDYIQAYTEIDAYSASAYLTDGILLDTTDAVKVTFVSDSAISSIPEGAVAITGVEATESYDAETKTLTLTPADGLAAGTEYTVTFDTEALEGVGMLYKGSALNFKVKGYGLNYFINDDFNTDGNIGAWKYVYGNESGKNITLKQTTLNDGTGVMEFGADRYSSRTTTTSPTISNNFKDIMFSGAEEIVIETRFMTTGGQKLVKVDNDGDGVKETDTYVDGTLGYFKFNQPEDKSLAGIAPPSNGGGYLGSQGGTLVKFGDAGFEYKVTNGYTTANANTALTSDEWINAKIVLTPNVGVYGTYSITTWEDGKEDEAVTKTDGVLQENSIAFYDPQAYKDNGSSLDGLTATKYTSLNNLLYVIDNYSNTVYVDYIKGYTTLVPDKDITGAVLESDLIAKDESVVLVLETEDELDSAITDAFAIEGVSATVSYDSASKTVTIDPDADLAMSKTYTLAVDVDALYDAGVVYKGAESFTFKTFGYGKNYFVNDEFNTENDLCGWSYGIKTASTTEGFIEQTTEDGAGVMHLARTDTNGSGDYRAEVRADRDFNDIALDGNKIVVEARMKSTGNTVTAEDGTSTTSGKAYLRFNSPSATTYAWVLDTYDPAFHWTGWNGGVLAKLNSATSSIKYKKTAGTVADALTNIGANNTWANVKMVIDGTDGTLNDYTFSVWADGNEANATTLTGSLGELSIGADMYDPDYEKETGSTKSAYDTFKNLAFSLQGKNDLYVDYVKAYIDIAYDAEFSASLDVDLIDKADSIVLNIATEDTLTEIPEGAFYIDGVEAAESYDADAKTLTLTPEADLDSKATYKVKVDTEALVAEGINYTGKTEFTFKTIGVGYNYYINDDFNTTGDLGNWVLGVTASNPSNTVTLTQDTVEGSGVMKLSASADTGITNKIPSVLNNFKDIELAANKVIIETRVKATGNGTTRLVDLKMNRPNDVKYLGDNSNHNLYGWAGNTILRIGGFNGVGSTDKDGNDNSQYTHFGYKSTANSYATMTLSETMGADWVNIKLVINKSNWAYDLTIWEDGKEDTPIVKENTPSEFAALSEYKPAHYDLENYIDAENAGTLDSYVAKTRHEFLKSLSFTLPKSGDLLVDYFRLYTDVAPDVEFTASIPNDLISKTDSVVVNIESESEITSIPEGMFTIDGVALTESYDAATKTLTLAPAEGFAEKTTYTVNVDKAALYSAGINYTGETALTFKTLGPGVNYFVNDDFNTEGNIGKWKLVYGTEGGKNITFKQTTLTDGTGVMEFGADRYSSAATTSSPTISTDFADIDLDTNKIVIETRYKSVGGGTKGNGDTGSRNYFKYNQPEDKSLAGYSSAGGYLGANGGTFIEQNATDGVKYKSGAYSTSVHDANLVTGEWISAKIVIDNTDGTYSDYTLTTWEDGNEANAVTTIGTMAENGNYYYNPALFKDEDTTNDWTRHMTLQNLLFVIREYSDTMYIDYVKAAIIGDFNAKATIDCGASVKVGKPIKVKFNTDVEIASIPLDAVTIDGVETTNTYDAATNTLTVKPASLTEGTIYTLNIDKAKLEAAVTGLTYDGLTSFSVRARGDREKGLIISDNFDDGTTQGWAEGVANEGYKAVLDVVDIDGEEGNKALKVSMNATKSGNGNQPTVFKTLGNGIEFKNGEHVIITTRIKKSADLYYKLKANRPNTIEQILNEYEWSAYGIMGSGGRDKQGNETATETTTSTSRIATATDKEGSYTNMPADPNGTAVGTDWITYTIIFKPETGCYWVAGVKDDGTYVTKDGDGRVGAMYIAGTALERIYGINPGNNANLTFLDSLTFMAHNGTTGELLIDYIDVKVVDTTFIGKAEFMVGNKEAIEIAPNTTVKPVFTINPEEGVTNYTVISALYVDGIMKDTHINTVDATEMGFVYTEEDGWTIPSALEGKYEIKAFVWNTLDGLKPVSDVAKIESAANTDLTVYVQANNLGSTGTGEKNSPVASLDEALDVVAAKKASGYTGEANIIVGDGTYEISETISIAKTDVPANGLNIAAAYGAEPTFVGGVSYSVKNAVKVTDTAVLDRLHSQDAKDNLYVLNLTTKVALGDIPALNYPGSYNVTKQLKDLGLENPPATTSEIAIDGKLLTNARYPNTGYVLTGTVVDEGIRASYFDEKYIEEGTYIEPTLENVTHGFTTKIGYDNLDKWATADQAMMFGYWRYDWATQTLPLKSVDLESSTVTAKYASVYGLKEGARFYIYNLLEEIDMPGEYFIDRKTGNLYFYMPEDADRNGTITMSMLEEAMLKTPQSCQTPITIDGLNFTTSRGTGIAINGSYNTTVRNCEVSNVASYGISAFGKNALVENCYVHDTNGGISVGSDSAAVDAKTLTKTNNVITNNKIERFSRISKTYTPAIQIYAIGNTVTHNELTDGEGTALMYSGQNNTIQYNEIHNVCKEVEDAGAIYVGRSWVARGNKVLNNYFHDIQPNIDTSTGGRSPVAAIFLDDHYAGAYIEGNVFENIYGDGIRGNAGREHTINNNIFIDCSLRGVYMSDAKGTLEDYETQVEGASNELYQTDVWKEEFPELANIMSNDPEKSKDHVHTNNLYVNCGTNGYVYGTDAQELAKAFANNYVTTADPGFVDMANKNYELKADSVVFTEIPDFVQIDMSKMGIQK